MPTLNQKLLTADAKMLEAMENLKTKGVIRFTTDFCTAIEMPKQSIPAIKNGDKHFTPKHIELACKEYRLNANWVLGLEKNMFRP